MTGIEPNYADTHKKLLIPPFDRRARRAQLQISERRLLLMLGDIAAVALSVLIGLRVWAFVADEPFSLDFIVQQSYLFVILMGMWLLLASANDLYVLRIAASRMQTFQRLIAIN